eukprot:472267-Prorocentrum_lima.AAC.1
MPPATSDSLLPAPEVKATKQTEAPGGVNPKLLEALKVLEQPARKSSNNKAGIKVKAERKSKT